MFKVRTITPTGGVYPTCNVSIGNNTYKAKINKKTVYSLFGIPIYIKETTIAEIV